MEKYYLAIDIGASGGRHILGSIRDGRLRLEEIYRFENGPVKRKGHLCWDLDRLYREILFGMKECARTNRIPTSMGIDTWGVDYVLLDRDNRLIGDSYCYRDHRTDGMDRLVEECIPFEELYGRTGIQKQIFNTINQLMAVRHYHPEWMEQAEDFLMLPDYFHFLLTGRKLSEYTNATTTQLVKAANREWDEELIGRLGFKKEMFHPLADPMTTVGTLREELAQEVGFQCKVVQPPTHDTGAAVMAVPSLEDDHIYISSGTWSLMGISRQEPDCSGESLIHNFTNEGGFGGRFRYLKNIMGLWMIQSVRQELNRAYSYGELCDMAEACKEFPSRVQVNDPCFLAPESMTEEIKAYLKKTGQRLPESVGELAACIYQSLADSYAQTVKEIEELTGRTYSRIHIIGGGSNAVYLNELTARATGKVVCAGPTEATSIGNLTAQLLAAGELPSLEAAKSCIYASFDIHEYEYGRYRAD